MIETIGHAHFLFIADCKAASLETRAVISHEEGSYLFPLPMTGKVPETLRELVLTPPVNPEPITLMDITTPDGQPKVVGQGFEVDKEMAFGQEDGPQHIWQERWLVTRSDALAKRKQKTWRNRLQRAEAKLTSLKAKKEESAAALLARAEKIVKHQHLTDIITVQVEETVTQEKH